MSRTLMLLSLTLMFACAPRPARPRPQAPISTLVSGRDANIERACQVIDPSVLPSCQDDDVQWQPPSRLLESAIDAYSHEDNKQAMILLTDAIVGKGGDDGCGQQRAVYYRAKLLYRLGRYDEAFGEFVRFIQAGPDSAYYAATAKWIAALRDKLPAASLDVCLGHYRSICPLM